MLNFIKLSLVIPSILLITACGTVETVNDWFTEDVYVAPPAELTEFPAEFEPNIVWSIDTGAGSEDDQYSDLAAWVQGEMIISVDYEGETRSYNNQTGRQLWQTELDVPVVSGAGGGDGYIFVGTQEGQLIALNETDGKVEWTTQLSSEVLSPAKAANGIAVVRTADGRLTGLSVTEGVKLWSYQRSVPLLSLRGASEPVITGDKVIAGYANGKLVALSLVDGGVIWEKSVAIPKGRTQLARIVDIDSAPVVVEDRVYVVAYNGRVAALSLDDGNIEWYREFSSRSGLDVDIDDAVYISDDSDYVWALQDGTGDALWRQTRLIRRKVTAPVIVGNHVIVGDLEGYVHWISRDDGRFVARTRVADQAIRSKPVVKDDLVFVTASDGTLTAFRIQ